MTSRTLSVMLVCASLAASACASAPARQSAGSTEGQYLVRTQSQSFLLAGQLAVLDDYVSLTLDRTWCRRLDAYKTGTLTRFSCNPIDGLTSLTVDVDAANPVYASRWSGTVTRQRSVRTCVATAIVNGREVCTSYKDLSEEYQAPISGRLMVTAAAKAP